MLKAETNLLATMGACAAVTVLVATLREKPAPSGPSIERFSDTEVGIDPGPATCDCIVCLGDRYGIWLDDMRAARGVELHRVPAASFLHQVGFREGDVVLRVNGRDFLSPSDAPRLFEKLANDRILVVDLLRAGRPLELRLVIGRRASRDSTYYR